MPAPADDRCRAGSSPHVDTGFAHPLVRNTTGDLTRGRWLVVALTPSREVISCAGMHLNIKGAPRRPVGWIAGRRRELVMITEPEALHPEPGHCAVSLTAPSRNSASNFLRFSRMTLPIVDASTVRGILIPSCPVPEIAQLVRACAPSCLPISTAVASARGAPKQSASSLKRSAGRRMGSGILIITGFGSCSPGMGHAHVAETGTSLRSEPLYETMPGYSSKVQQCSRSSALSSGVRLHSARLSEA
jgi:hypothetical protein